MNRSRLLGFSVSGCVAAAAMLVMFSDAGAVEIEELSKCRAVTDVTARAECYDRIVDAAAKRGEKDVPAFTARKPPAPEQKTVQISKATRANNGRLTLLTTEGEIWAQTEGDGPPKEPEAGASMTISKGIMGGFFCSLDKYTTFRCKLRNN